MSENLPVISVIVPIYNTEKYLERCVNSIAGQTYKSLEIILVDDGSRDGSPEIEDEWGLRDERAVIIHKPNGGAADAKNYGLRLFSGRLLAIADSDDWLSVNMYEELYELLEHYNADIADSEAAVVSLREAEIINDGPEKIDVFSTEEALENYLNDNKLHVTLWNKLYRRSTAEGIFFVKGKYIDDEYWTYKVIDRCKKYVFTSKMYYYYYKRSGSAMQSEYSAKRLDAVGAKDERYYYLKDKYPMLEKKLLEGYVGTCRFHYQMLCYYRNVDRDGTLRKQLLERIRSFDNITLNSLYTGKNKLWFRLFLIWPEMTCRVRNMFKIGW